MGALVDVSPPNKAPSPPMWNTITQWILCKISACQCTNVKSSNWRPSRDDSVGNEQRQGTRRCVWKRSNRTARPSAQVSMNTKRLQTCLRYFFKVGPRPYRGLRASADRVNVWSLLCFLIGSNHHWNVKWTMKPCSSLHHWHHIIRFILIACYMLYLYFSSLKTAAIPREILTYINVYICKVGISSGHRLIWWGVMRYRFALNPMLHRTILRVSITFA